MSYLRCLNCGEVCSEDELETVKGDSYEYWGETGTADSLGCSSCGWDDFEEVELCVCGHDYIADGEGLCDACKEEVANDFKRFCRELTEAQLDYLFEELLEDDDYVKTI